MVAKFFLTAQNTMVEQERRIYIWNRNFSDLEPSWYLSTTIESAEKFASDFSHLRENNNK